MIPYYYIPAHPEMVNVHYISKSDISKVDKVCAIQSKLVIIFSWDEVPEEGNEMPIELLIERIENETQASIEKEPLFPVATICHEVIQIDDGHIISKRHIFFKIIENLEGLCHSLDDELKKRDRIEDACRHQSRPILIRIPDPVKRIACTACGADITEKNKLKENSKFFCLPCYVAILRKRSMTAI